MLLIKKAYTGEFKHLLSILRQASLDNRSYVTFPKKKFNYLFILKQLQEEGLIESYEHRGELLVITMKLTYWKSFQIPIKSFSTIASVRLNRRSTASSKQISKAQTLQGQAVHFIISTDQGIMSGLEATKNKIGGLPLLKIY